MTKRGIEINSEIDPKTNDQILALWKRVALWDKIADTIKWARLYGGAVAVLLIDGQRFDTPLRAETVGRNAFKGLLVLDRWTVQPSLHDLVQTLGPDMGQPRTYQVTGNGQAGLLTGQTIHYSRVIRLDGVDLPYFQRVSENLWGQSVLERLFDRLLAFDSTTQGAAQLVYKAHLRTYKVEGLREIIAMGGQALEGLTKQIDFVRQTQTNEGMTLMDAKDEFEAHSYSFGGLDVVLLQFAQQLSGALNIPLTRLFGQSPAGMNSTGESDLTNYYDGIEQEQERRLRAGVMTLLEVSHRSLTGRALPEGSDFTFRSLWQMSDTEKAQITTATAGAVTQAFTSGVIGRQTALKELRQSSRITGAFSNITDATIAAASDDVDAGEFGAADDPFGETDAEDKSSSGRKPARDSDFKEGEHPRNEQGEFAAAGSSSASASPLHPDIAPHFQHINQDLTGQPQKALAWVRGGSGRFVPGALAHPDIEGGIGLLHGVPGDPNKDWRRGFGVSHMDAKRPGHLDEAVKIIPSLPVVESETVKDPKTGRVMGKVLSDGRHRAVVSMDLRGHATPAWLLTSYERP